MRAILTYHSIDDSGSPISLSPATFERHLDWLASGKVRVLPLERLRSDPTPGDAVAITFDDALAALADPAWPELRRRGLPATVFAPLERLGQDNAWGGKAEPGIPRLPVIDRETLRRLSGEGLAVGSHGLSHRDLRRLPDQELVRELEASRERLGELTGQRPSVLAYPYGAVDRRVVRAAGRVYAAGVTTDLRPLGRREDPLRLPRIDAWYLRSSALLEAWGTPRFRAYLSLRRALRHLRRAAQSR
jgi:peptidoglycan/xylan/chitin deacetylase (PgdA/CDA1 family)